ncbi:MAG: nitrogenase component 1, partial [Eubacteriales bacterium]|nr:nitrogenase component 1 [Eubacteriales bacterium]
MGLIKHFPTPSDRMGIIWSALPIKDAIVIEYGPNGTTHYGTELFMDLGIDIEKQLQSTHIGEDDIIMGETKRLKEAILEVDELYSPKIIFVVGSSLTSVVAADIKAVCKSLEKNVNAKIIPFEHGGFRGDFSLGIKDFFNCFKDIIIKQEEKDCKKYNIIGANHDFYRIGSDVEEIKNIMKQAFNMEVNCILPYKSSVDEITNMDKACLNIVIRNEALELAKHFDTPYIYSLPYGYKMSLDFIEEIENILNIKANDEIKQNIIEKQNKNIKLLKTNCFFPFPIYLEGNYDVIKSLGYFIEEELGLKVKKAFCNHSLKNIDNEVSYIVNVSEEEKLAEIKNLKNAIIFGSEPTIN